MSFFAMPPALAAYILVLMMLIGACAASGLSCFAARYCKGESWLNGRSHCDVCGHVLEWRDLIPVVSYLVLRGKCRYCKEKIGNHTLVGEIFLAVVFAALLMRYGITWELPKALVLVMVLYPAALCDMESFEIPNRFALIGTVCWLIFLPFTRNWRETLTEGLIGSLAVTALIVLISWMMGRILKKDTMGGGDLKLYALAGLYLGPFLNLLNIMMSCILGMLFHGIFAARAVRDEDLPEGAFPFGPAIALSTLFCMLAGQRIVDWYLGLIR